MGLLAFGGVGGWGFRGRGGEGLVVVWMKYECVERCGTARWENGGGEWSGG